MRGGFLIVIIAAYWLATAIAVCIEDSDCPDVSTCEIGKCANETCSTEIVCTCGDFNVTKPWEECDPPGPLCSSDCEKLGICLRIESVVSCEDEADGETCVATDGHYVESATCDQQTVCCDDGECSMEYPPTCFAFKGRPRGNATCADTPDPCLMGCCCASDLLYGAYQGALPVFFESECCVLDGVLRDGERNCTRLGFDEDDQYPFLCDFGACICTGILTQDRSCTNTTKAECEELGCDWVPLSACERNRRGGRCGIMCATLAFLIPAFVAIAACCCGLLSGIFLRTIRDDDEDEGRSKKDL